MPSIGRKKSVLLSKILSIIVFVFLTLAIFLIQVVVKYYFSKIGLNSKDFINTACVILYASLPPAFIAVFYLYRLLCNIEKDNVFIRGNVHCLRIISWCCCFVGFIYFAAGFYFETAFVISFAAFFIFLILRVVKNVFEAAVELKEVNDYTI